MNQDKQVKAYFSKRFEALGFTVAKVVLMEDLEITEVYTTDGVYSFQCGSDDDEFYFTSPGKPAVSFPIDDEWMEIFPVDKELEALVEKNKFLLD